MALNQLLNSVIRQYSKVSRNKERTYDAYLVGYYGMRNSGDDALLLASVMGAKNELNAKKLIVSSTSNASPLGPDIILNKLHQDQSFKGQNRLAHYRAAYNSKRIIFGGGSVFHTAQDIELKRQMMALCGSDESIAVGVSMGPFSNKQAELQCKEFIKECSFIGVRDRKSLQIAKDLVPEANVKLTFDLAPLVTLTPFFSIKKRKENGVLINICPVPVNASGETNSHEQEELLKNMKEVITLAWKQTKLPITLISLNGHPDYGDDELCKRLILRCNKDIPIKFEPYQSSPLKVIELIKSYRAFLSMRLHGCVYGYLANTPVLALNYHNKCQQWCEQIGIARSQRFSAFTFNPSLVASTLTKGIENGFSSPLLAVNDAVKLSLLNWRFES